MGAPTFPVPEDVHETIRLLNATHTWNISLVDRGSRILVLDGDQIQFIAETRQEAEAFLAACFLLTFQAKSLEQIREEIIRGRFDELFGEDALDEVERERREYANRKRAKNMRA